MVGSFRYVTSYFYIGCLALGAVGCGSSKEKCLPAVSANAVGGVTGDADARARADADAAARAGANATMDAAGSAQAKLPPTDAELKEAAQLRAKARANLDAGRLREALPDLERAFALSGDVTMLGDLGLSLDAAGRFDEAWIAMARFRAEARAAYEPVRAKIDAKLGELEKKLGGLIIDTDTPGAEVIVRGQVVARLPLATPIFLAPGDASVIVRAPGKPDFNLRARVAVGAVARASANLAGLGAGVAGGVVGGVGGTLGGLGGTLGRPTGAVGGTLGGVGGTLGGVGGGLGRPSGGVGGVGVGAVGGVAGGVGGVAGGVGAPALPLPPPPAPPIWPIVVGAGGIVVVGGAIAASVVYKGHLDDFDAKLCGKSGAAADCPAIESSLKLTKGLQVAGYLVGGLALTGGIIAFAVTRSATGALDADCPKVGKPAPLRLSCGVGADGQGGGVSCVGKF